MGVINTEDIVGYWIEQECVCRDCVSKEEAARASQDDIITAEEVDSGDNLYFCDRCKGRIG